MQDMYDLELDRVISDINKRRCKNVLLQLPDGLKPKAKEIAEKIEKETGALALIWISGCFGGCDLPLGISTIGVDMVIAFGHNKFSKEKEGW